MSSFTDKFFSDYDTGTYNKTFNNRIDKTSTFTDTFFSNKNKTKESISDFTHSYNAFIDELNIERKSYYKRLNEERQKRYEEELNNRAEQMQAYYNNHKNSLQLKRSNDLIYNWDLSDSGGVKYNYGDAPIQNNKGYLKKKNSKGEVFWEDAINKKLYNDKGELVEDLSSGKTFSISIDEPQYVFSDIATNAKGFEKRQDNKGNIYWVDTKEDLLYDDEGNLINDDRLKDTDFMNSLKPVYESNDSIKLNPNRLNKVDAIGVTPIEYSRYAFLTQTSYESPDVYINNHYKDGWIVKDGKYYKPSTSDSAISIDGKKYEEVIDEKPNKLFEQVNTPSGEQQLYNRYFDKLNKAIKNGEYTTANNTLQEINKLYFGHSYDDGWLASVIDSNSDDYLYFQNRFMNNVEQLEIINDALENTTDPEVLNNLREEKNKLELENTLIQYNRLFMINSNEALLSQMELFENEINETWRKYGELVQETFDEFDDGYDFGDAFKTVKHVFNNGIQFFASTAATTNDIIQMNERLLISDMDDSEFKQTWLPAILDVATYMIPVVGTARFVLNVTEPGGTVVSGVLREKSATINGEHARIPTVQNIGGAALNIAANYVSNLVFGKIRSSMSPETIQDMYKHTGKLILATLLEESIGEGGEEFIQTFAEYMQNAEKGETVFTKEHFEEALKSALIAFVTAGGASATGMTIGEIRYGYKNKVNISGDATDNIKINRNLKENTDTTIYNVSNTKNYDQISYNNIDNTNVKVETDNDAVINIATELQNGNIVTLLDSSAVKINSADTEVNLDNNNITLSDAVVNDNIKTVLVPSKEIETYLKNLRDDLTIYTFDPKEDGFMNNIKEYVTDVGKSNIVTKNVTDFVKSDTNFSPDEMADITNIVNQALNRGIFVDRMNGDTDYKGPNVKLDLSDITSTDINTIINNVKNKFLEEVNKNTVSKSTAQKEFASLSKKLSEYSQKSKANRTYIKDNKNNIISFIKKGSNLYEALNTIPTRSADLEVFANVATNGNIINGNLNKKLQFSKQQLNNVNNLIDKLGLKGNYLTPDSTYKNLTSLIKTNPEFSKEILQALGVDGLIEGKNKVRLYTAYDNLDNANIKGALENTTKDIKEKIAIKEIVKKANSEAPKIATKSIEQSKVDINDTPISTDKYAYNPDDTTELNNIEAEQFIDELFDKIKFTDKNKKIDANELKTTVRKLLFDRYVHINEVAKENLDYDTRAALSEYAAVSNDAQQMIKGAQIMNNEVVGKSLDQIYKDAHFTKKQSQLFDKYMLLQLNAERETAGVEKIFPNISKEKSIELANKLAKQNKSFEGVASDLQRYNNNLLNMLVNDGVITEQLANKLKNRYKYYMPIYSSDLSTFVDLDSDKYLKRMKVDDTIKDVTKTGKQIQSLRKSMENKTYNVLNAIAKNKLLTTMADNGNYKVNNGSDAIFYRNGKIDKLRTSSGIISDINDNTLQHWADILSQVPVLKQMVDLNNLSYRFILDPIYQIKNVMIDFTDSQLVYSKDKAHFAKNYIRAVIAIANNSELANEFREVGLGEWGNGLTAPYVTYDENGKVQVRQNKFQRIYANLEAMPKLAEYISLKEKYMKQARLDYKNGKYDNLNNKVLKNKDGSIKHFYHGTDAFGFDEFDSRYNDKTRSYGKTNKLVAFFSDSKENAQTYAKDTNNVYDVHLIMKKPLVVDCKGETWQNIDSKSNPFGHTKTDDIINSAINSGKYDGVIFNNIQDRGPKFHGKLESKITNDYVVFDNSQIIQAKNYNNNMSIKNVENQIKLQAKVEAQDVNLNFNMGGTGSKALSKMGFKFLNAGMLGFDKFVTHVGEDIKTPKGMGSLLLEFTAIGATTAIANAILNGDDDDYDKLPYYYKNNYYMIKIDDGKYLRIPKGRVQTLYNVLFEYSTGIRKEDDIKTYYESIKSAFDLAVMPPALEQASPWGAFTQLIENKDAFGNPIYSEEYDTTSEKAQKAVYHLLSNYFGRYGRMVKDITDEDGTTDILNEFDYYKDTTKANRHYQTALNLVEYYKNSDNVKTLDDKAMKKYIDTQNYALRTINSEINQGKKEGKTTKELAAKYAARDNLIQSMIENYKDFTTYTDENGNIWYYFDDQIFMYNVKTQKFVKKTQK